MGKLILHLRVHGYDELSDVLACSTTEVSDIYEACVAEEEMSQSVASHRALCKELYVQATLLNNNEVVYQHGYQLI